MTTTQKSYGRSAATCILLLLTTAWAHAADPANKQEDDLIAVLRGDSPAEKALACKRLAVHGTIKAVPELAKLLTDEQLASWARIALEVIPGTAADEALIAALDTTQGNLLIGTVNSLGVRRAEKAVAALTGRIADQNADVASAAAVALGHIGNSEATQALLKALTAAPPAVRSAVAEGCILCAERLQAGGQDAQAAEIFDKVRKADVPKPRILEATRGAILARKEQGIPLLLEQLRSEDRGLFQMALSTAREIPGRQVDESLAGELKTAAPERAPLLIAAMADRQGTVLLPAILAAAAKGPKQVRIAAIEAVGRVGDSSCVSSLLEIAQDSDAELGRAAKQALASLPGEKVNQEIQSKLATADAKNLAILLELVGERRIPAHESLLKAVGHSDQVVRRAALVSLGNTIPPQNFADLIALATSQKRPDDAAVAQTALKTAAVRMPDREECATALATAFAKSSGEAKPGLLEILGAVGGTKALQTLGAAAKSSDSQLQDVSTRLLGEWMTIDAAPVLLDLSQAAPGEKYQVRAMRGYIRIARQFVIPEEQRAAMCEQAFAAARQPEQKLVLDVVKRYPVKAMRNVVLAAAQVPTLRQDAAEVALLIVPKLSTAEARELLTKVGLDRVKVEIVKAEYGAGSVQKDVTDMLRKQAADLPFIVLPAADYNASFGGDPVPGAVKQLKVQYRINGKGSEKLFAENAPIVLPIPK